MIDADPILVYERFVAAMRQRDTVALRACLHATEPMAIERALAPTSDAGTVLHRHVVACCIDGDTATLETIAMRGDHAGSGSVALVHDGAGWRVDARSLCFAD